MDITKYMIKLLYSFGEWCAEAYMETDYSSITEKDFERTVRKYAIYKAVGIDECEVNGDEDS